MIETVPNLNKDIIIKDLDIPLEATYFSCFFPFSVATYYISRMTYLLLPLINNPMLQGARSSIGHATKSLTPPLDLVISEANFI